MVAEWLQHECRVSPEMWTWSSFSPPFLHPALYPYRSHARIPLMTTGYTFGSGDSVHDQPDPYLAALSNPPFCLHAGKKLTVNPLKIRKPGTEVSLPPVSLVVCVLWPAISLLSLLFFLFMCLGFHSCAVGLFGHLMEGFLWICVPPPLT